MRMKNILNLLVTIMVGLSCTLWLTSCGSASDHAGHDHAGHDHANHDHAEQGAEDPAANTANQLAGAISEAASQVTDKVEAMSEEAIIAAQSAVYPLEKCVVSGEALGSMGESVNVVHEGTLIKICCDHCKPDLDKDPAKFVAMVKTAAGK
jgi:hypothetical protein